MMRRSINAINAAENSTTTKHHRQGKARILRKDQAETNHNSLITSLTALHTSLPASPTSINDLGA